MTSSPTKDRPWLITLGLGRHATKTYGEIVLTAPEYVRSVLMPSDSQLPSQKLKYLEGTIEVFDKLPFQSGCQCTQNIAPCASTANYATTTHQKGVLALWCTECESRRVLEQGNGVRKLHTYKDALKGIEDSTNGEENWLSDAFIRAKTGDMELTAENCHEFFDLIFIFERMF